MNEKRIRAVETKNRGRATRRVASFRIETGARASSHIYITIGDHVTTFARRASRFRVCLYSSTCARRGKSCKAASVARLLRVCGTIESVATPELPSNDLPRINLTNETVITTNF